MIETPPRPWHAQARPNQLPPAEGDWRVYLMQVGRGWGATRASAEWIAEQAATHPNTEWAVVATPPCVRKICLEGYSGVLRALLPGELESYSDQDLSIRLTNGSTIRGFAANDLGLARLRGYDLAGAWLDGADGFRHVIDKVWDAVTCKRIVVTAPPPLHGWALARGARRPRRHDPRHRIELGQHAQPVAGNTCRTA